MITTKTLSKELGFSLNVIQRAKKFLGIVGERTNLPSGGFTYVLSKEDADRIKLRQESIEDTRGRSYKPCRTCRENGHTSLRCPDNPAPMKCGMCEQTKNRCCFPEIKRTLPNGEKTRFIVSTCNDCSNEKHRKNYTTSIPHRFAALVNGIRSRQPDSTLSVDILIEKYKAQDGRCFYSGIELSLDTGDFAISIDQVVPRGGYTPENTVLTCWIVNHMKKNLSASKFVEICTAIAIKQGKTTELHFANG